MSNLPDDFNTHAFNRMHGETAEEACPAAAEDVQNAHAVYRRTLDAIVQIAKDERVLLSKHHLEVMMEGIGEALYDAVDSSVRALREAGDEDASVYPDDSKALLTKGAADLIDHFRIKPVNTSAMLAEILKPLNPVESLPFHSTDIGKPV